MYNPLRIVDSIADNLEPLYKATQLEGLVKRSEEFLGTIDEHERNFVQLGYTLGTIMTGGALVQLALGNTKAAAGQGAIGLATYIVSALHHSAASEEREHSQ